MPARYLPHLAARVQNTSLMIHPGKLHAILGAIGHRIGLGGPTEEGKALLLQAGEESFNLPEKKAESGAGRGAAGGNIAVIPVHDSLVHHRRGMSGWSGLTSYEEIGEWFHVALEDPAVYSILFDIDSPGGEAAGVMDLSDEIYRARGRKPIYAIANSMAFSAAYAIASAADEVFVERIGGVGSIGVIAVHVDQSGWNEKIGVKYTPVFAGKRKNDYSPHAPLSDEAFTRLQAMIDRDYDLFVETVARNRNMAAKDVRATEAGTFDGDEAVSTGLADRVMSWGEAVDYIISKQGGRVMNAEEMRTQMEGLLTTPDVDGEAVLADLGYVPKADGEGQGTGQDLEAARNEGREEALGRVTGIMDLCNLAGMPDAAASMIREGLSVEDARKRILEKKGKAAGKDEIVSTVGGLSTGELNPLVENARKRAEERKK